MTSPNVAPELMEVASPLDQMIALWRGIEQLHSDAKGSERNERLIAEARVVHQAMRFYQNELEQHIGE